MNRSPQFGQMISSLLMGLLLVVACEKDPEIPVDPVEVPILQIPEGFPEVQFPEDNAFSKERWELGKKLFFETRLSKDNSVSCGSCHHPQLAFSDDRATSPGAFDRPGVRNAPGLFNLAYHPYYLREGSVPTLEMQALVPIQEENEFAHNILDITNELSADSTYVSMARETYDREFDPFVLTRALGVFQRTLISGNSDYDRFERGDADALTPAQIRGKDLFFSNRTNCSSCHGGLNFTGYAFENNGLYVDYADNGRRRVTNDPADEARFKVPSLRNVGVTAPYMHDGSLKTLSEVVAHYNSGGYAHVNKSELVKPLGLTESERADLVAFLESLTDQAFLSNPNWQP